jgi:hypothetical protein
MPHWKARVDLKQEWSKARNGELSPCELGRIVAIKVGETLVRGGAVGLKSILGGLFSLPADASFDDFDDALEPLYDWADQDHRLWIGTF